MRSDGGRAEKSDEGFGTGATGGSSTETNACLLRSLSCSMENGLSGGQRESRVPVGFLCLGDRKQRAIGFFCLGDRTYRQPRS